MKEPAHGVWRVQEKNYILTIFFNTTEFYGYAKTRCYGIYKNQNTIQYEFRRVLTNKYH